MAFWAFILTFGPLIWPLGLCFWHFWALRGGILWSFWPFGPSGGVSFGSLSPFEPSGGVSFTTSGLRSEGSSHKLPKMVRLCAFISFRFGLLGLHFSFSASILAFGASRLPLRALRGGVSFGSLCPFGPSGGVSFCSLLPFEPPGGYPVALCGLHRAPGRDLPSTPEK